MSVQTLQSMVGWVKDHALENPTLSSLSASFSYSPYYCSVQFREYVGVTIKKYVAKVKVETAASLLCSGRERIVDIALDCGYASHEALTRAFVQAYSCSPTEYRSRYCEQTERASKN